MKPVSLLLLLSSVLLSSHLRPAAGRPRSLPDWLDSTGRLDPKLVRAAAAGDGTALELLDNILRILRSGNPEHLHLPHAEQQQQEEVEEEESDDEVLKTAAQLLKRSEYPPMSIDLPLHMLRNMMEIAKQEDVKQRALLNRKLFNEVGK